MTETDPNTNDTAPPAVDPLEETLPADSNIPTLQASESQPDHLPGSDANDPTVQAADAEFKAKMELATSPGLSIPVELYTLTSADAAAINAHLEGDYVKEGLQIPPLRDLEGNLFVQVYEAKVLLGVAP